jgi:hypothetical protein
MATIVPGRKKSQNLILLHLISIGYNFIDEKKDCTNRFYGTKWYMPIWHIKDRILFDSNRLKDNMPFWDRRFWRGSINSQC